MSPVCSPFARRAHTESIPRSQDRYAQLFHQLTREFQPVGVAEQLAIADMARHASCLEHGTSAPDARQRIGAKAIVEFLVPGDLSESEIENLICDVANRPLDQSQLVVHSRAFQCALRLFLKLRAKRPAYDQRRESRYRFDSEDECLKHLATHQQRNFACASYGTREAYLILARRCDLTPPTTPVFKLEFPNSVPQLWSAAGA
jgi:hypothetical protein